MKNINEIPCINCVTLSMCVSIQSKYKFYELPQEIFDKCSIIHEYCYRIDHPHYVTLYRKEKVAMFLSKDILNKIPCKDCLMYAPCRNKYTTKSFSGKLYLNDKIVISCCSLNNFLDNRNVDTFHTLKTCLIKTFKVDELHWRLSYRLKNIVNTYENVNGS